MLKICKKKMNWVSEHPIKFSIGIFSPLIISYIMLAVLLKFGLNLSADAVISIDVALITIIITSIGLSISGYIFLNGYFGTVIKGDRSLSNIIGNLNKAYICRIIWASIASMFFIACAFRVIFNINDVGEAKASVFTSLWDCVFQHITYIGSMGTILYNFHFLCHIINPDKLIKKRAMKVANDQMKFLIDEFNHLPGSYKFTGQKWRECKEFSIMNDSTRLYAKGKLSVDSLHQVLSIIKYIYEMEAIITKVIELNAIGGKNSSEAEALKLIFADRNSGFIRYKKRIQISDIKGFPYFYQGEYDEKYDEFVMNSLIEEYVFYYDQLILLKNALIKMEKEKIENLEIKDEVNAFVALMVRVTLNFFSDFVKMTELDVGGGYFTYANLSWSDLSDSNLTGSDFSAAYMESAILRGSDLSNSKLNEVYIPNADFKNVNLGYASIIGANCECINMSRAKLTDVIFHPPNIIQQHKEIKKQILNLFKDYCIDNLNNLESFDLEGLEMYSSKVEENGKKLKQNEKITNLVAATLDNVILKSVDLSAIKMFGASFASSVLSGSLWLYTIEAVGLKMQKVNFRNALAVRSNFSMSNFQDANLSETVFVDVNMSQTNFINVNGVSMKVYGSSEKVLLDNNKTKKILPYNNRQFSKGDFRLDWIKNTGGCSNWLQINFQNMNAVASQWHNTLLNESDFSGAILKNATFKNIAANWVNMENADLTYSLLLDVSFRMAKLSFCVFTRAMLKNICFEDANLYKSNFIHARIEDTEFSGCNLNSSFFSYAIFKNCSFIDCGLNRINLQYTKFENVIFDNNSFLSILELYNKRQIWLDSCLVILGEKYDYRKIREKIKKKRISMKRKGSMVYINDIS